MLKFHIYDECPMCGEIIDILPPKSPGVLLKDISVSHAINHRTIVDTYLELGLVLEGAPDLSLLFEESVRCAKCEERKELYGV